MKKLMSVGFAVAAMANSVWALTPTGPDAYVVETATDLSYVDEGFAIPANAASTLYPGIFCPAGGPLYVDEVVWRNVKLTDIATYSAKMRTGGTTWTAATTFHVVTNDDGSVQCQFQVDGSPFYGFVMLFKQAGANVTARIQYARYAYVGGQQSFGGDMSQKWGANFTPNGVLTSTTRNIGYLSCTLREDAETVAAPSEVVLASTDEGDPDMVSFVHRPTLVNVNSFVCRGYRIEDIDSLTGEISQKEIKGGAWTKVDGYPLNEGLGTRKINLMYRYNAGRRMAVTITFAQSGRDVLAKASWGGHSYDEKELDEPMGEGVLGVSLGITNEANTAAFAVRNLTIGFRPRTRIVSEYPDCLLWDGKWTLLWPDVRLDESVTAGLAKMGGYSLSKTWHVCDNYLWESATTGFTSFYEYVDGGNNNYSVNLQVKQDDGGIWGKIIHSRYEYGKSLGYRPAGDYGVSITNTLTDAGPKNKTIAICGFTAKRVVKKRHTMMVGDDFALGLSPLWLKDIKLALAPSTGTEKTFAETVGGTGAIGVSGAGKVLVATDLPDSVGLEVDSGAAVVAADRAVGGEVRVAEGATLEFRLADGVRPKLTTSCAVFAPGAKIVLSGTAKDVPEEGEVFKLITGSPRLDVDPADIVCETSGDFAENKVRLFIDADGDLAATATPKKGLMLIFR